MTSTLIERAKDELGAALVPITVDQYHLMMEKGILREGEPIELIDGMLVMKDRSDLEGEHMHGPRHRAAIRSTDRLLRPIEDLEAFCLTQLPVTLNSYQEPEPDLSVIRGNEEDFASHHPEPADIVALMEVSLSSLKYDRTTKLAVYAGAGIPVYWIINLVDDVIEVYRKPIRNKRLYQEKTIYAKGKVVRLDIARGKSISIAVTAVIPAR